MYLVAPVRPPRPINKKESILKKAQSILKYALLIADIGAKLANCGSTSL